MPKPANAPQSKAPRPFFARAEVLVVAVLLLGALLWLVLSRLPGAGAGGATARVSITRGGNGESAESFTISLAEDRLLQVEGDLPVTLEVKDGAIRFVDSHCPDHLCEDFGWIRREGEWALCAPAGVLVSVQQA